MIAIRHKWSSAACVSIASDAAETLSRPSRAETFTNVSRGVSNRDSGLEGYITVYGHIEHRAPILLNC
jgi:hypothetical protein